MTVKRCFEYKGIPVQQAKGAFEVFQLFFEQERFTNVVEIGTSYGGLSWFLYEQSLIHKFSFRTYDISGQRLFETWKIDIPFVYRIGNCFQDSIQSEIIQQISNTKALMLCDGGNKPKEFKIFSESIDIGSYIMAHDYAADETSKQQMKGKIWNWCEIMDSDIEDAMIVNNLMKSKYYNQFANVAWLSCIKRG